MRGLVIRLLVISSVLILLSACSSANPTALNMKLGEFQAVNQDGQEVTLADFEGKIWVASFFFTHCSTVCPSLTANMADLQMKIAEEGIDMDLVSFSVDPEKDDPDAIKQYLQKFDADFSNWQALTGYSFEEIQQLSQQSFKSAMAKEGGDSDQVIHGTSFYLIDGSGIIVGKYSGLDVPTEEIIKDVNKMKK